MLSGTLAQFGFAAIQVDEGNSYTLRASEFGVTRQVELELNGIAGERRTFSHRQIGNTLISKQYESYGTPNATWNGLTSATRCNPECLCKQWWMSFWYTEIVFWWCDIS